MFEVTEISNATGIWSVIAEAHTSDGTLFLAERYADAGPLRLTYVVAFMPMSSADGYSREWVSGSYFDGSSTRQNREQARDAYLRRLRDSIWS